MWTLGLLSSGFGPKGCSTQFFSSNQVTIGNGQSLPISHIGNKTFTASNQFQLRLVFHVPNLSTNLISVSKFFFDTHLLKFLLQFISYL